MKPYPRTFVPTDLDPSDFSHIQPIAQALLDRPIESPAALEKWLLDFSEMSSVLDEYGSRRYIDKSCHTEDANIEKAFLHFVESIEPKFKPVYFELQKKFLSSPYRSALTDRRYILLGRKWQADVDLYRDENVPLETEVAKLVNEYDKLCGVMMVTVGGQELTLQQASRLLEEPDRAVRQEAWEAVSKRRLVEREKMDELFDQLMAKRQTIATNSGLPDFRTFQWKSLKRFDYTPEQCLTFADAIAHSCVPIVRELDRRRAKDLKIEKLAPWDLAVDPQNLPPLRPFPETDIDGFVGKTKTIFDKLSPKLASDFDSLRENKNLDLGSRKGKQPGGYQSNLEESRQPFIFMNAAGTQRDVETLLHEGGHAFHSLAARDEPLVFLRSAPMEFCEVASMTMELLGGEHLDVFYPDGEGADRARKTHFEGIVRFFPWMTRIDSFQHWLYTHPTHTRAQRTAEWLRLDERFGSKLDWTGHEAVLDSLWQRQLHLYHAPFYYIEYGIAQLGALQLWMMSREDPRKALANYRAALSLGGTRTLPELFAAAGIVFDFSAKTLEPLVAALMEQL